MHWVIIKINILSNYQDNNLIGLIGNSIIRLVYSQYIVLAGIKIIYSDKVEI